jgi:hypothetical protein
VEVPESIWETIAGGVAALVASLVGHVPRAQLKEVLPTPLTNPLPPLPSC